MCEHSTQESIGTMTKTYFWVSKQTSKEFLEGKESNVFTYTFPPEFMASRSKKWIVIEECKAVMKDKLVGDVILHADFIHRDHYLDYSCCFVNEEANRDTAKYEFNSPNNVFRLWFTDLNGNSVDIDAFVFRSLLCY